MAQQAAFSLVSSKQKVENDMRTQRCVLDMGVGVGRERGAWGGGAAAAVVHTSKGMQ